MSKVEKCLMTTVLLVVMAVTVGHAMEGQGEVDSDASSSMEWNDSDTPDPLLDTSGASDTESTMDESHDTQRTGPQARRARKSRGESEERKQKARERGVQGGKALRNQQVQGRRDYTGLDEDSSEGSEYEEASQEGPMSQQGGKIRIPEERADANQAAWSRMQNSQELIQRVRLFGKYPSDGNLKNLLTFLATKADEVYNTGKFGPARGTYKHTACYQWMLNIKAAYGNQWPALQTVKPEKLTDDGASRIDVLWIHGGNAKLYDYKFGKANNVSTPDRLEQYVDSLKKQSISVVGKITDIKSSHVDD